MEDFVRKTKGVRDINSLPLNVSHELDIVSDVKGKIYIKILNRYKELLFDNGTEQWVIDMLNNLEIDVEQLKENILDVEQALSELPMIADKLETVETELAQINTLFTQMQTDVNGLDLRTAELEREVVRLALKDQELLDKINNLNVNLDVIYSNTDDFGDYDYSGNPNLMRVIKASDFRRDGNSDVLVSDVGYNSIRLTSQGVNRLSAYTETNVSSLVSGKTYSLSAKIKIEEGTTGDIDQLRVAYRKTKDGTVLLTAISEGAVVGKEIIIKGTATVNYKITELERFYLEIKAISTTGIINGSFIVSDVKIEESSTVTPYQPNLLDDPYWLGNVPLGENIADPTKTFPINFSGSTLYQGTMTEPFIVGETYTITLKGTKPATQTFRVFNPGVPEYGSLSLVEGLTDVWSLTFTPDRVSTNPEILQIVQSPNESVGLCQIDWFKIEKGDTRTPNIPYYKYVGINLSESKNPNDYHWIPLAKATETVDDRLTKTITTSDTVNALQNSRLTELESKVVDTAWTNVTPISPFTATKQIQVKRQNGIVYMRGGLSDGTGDCFTLPEGFRPPNDGYEYHYLLPGRSTSQTDTAKIYVRPSGLCSIVSKTGTTPIFLEPIMFSIT